MTAVGGCSRARETLPSQPEAATEPSLLGHRAPGKQSCGLFSARWGRQTHGRWPSGARSDEVPASADPYGASSARKTVLRTVSESLPLQGHRAPGKQSCGLFSARWGRQARGIERPENSPVDRSKCLPHRGRRLAEKAPNAFPFRGRWIARSARRKRSFDICPVTLGGLPVLCPNTQRALRRGSTPYSQILSPPIHFLYLTMPPKPRIMTSQKTHRHYRQ